MTGRIVATVVAVSSVIVGVGPGLQAAPSPAPGVECTVADLGREVPWKSASGSFTLFCTPADEGGDHVPSVSADPKPELPQVQGTGYMWTAFAPPRATPFVGAALTGLSASDLTTSMRAEYQDPDVSPCKVNGRSIDDLVSLSYGRSGILGRRSPGMPDSLGKITVGVFPVVPSNLTIAANGQSASGTNEVTGQAVTVRHGDLKIEAFGNIQPYLRDYFREQSYGRMTLEFVTYDKILQGGVSQSSYKKRPAAVSNKALVENVATLTTSANHNFQVNEVVTVTGVDATFDGTYTITARTRTTFSFEKTAADVASTAVSPTGLASVDEPDFDNQAIAATRALRSVPADWWEGPGKDIDLLWVLEWEKPGAYLWTDPRARDRDGGVAKDLTIRNAAGSYRGLILSPARLPLSDRPLIAHEFGHALRLPDMYQQRKNTVASRMVARIGRMGSGYTVSGMFGWDRYINRWLSDSQVECVYGDRLLGARGEYVDVSLTPLQSPATGKPNKRLAVIPLMAEGTAIMVESWRPLGSDAASQANTREGGTGADGALVYLMDARASASSGLYVKGSWPYTGAPVVLYREAQDSVLPTASAFPAACIGMPDVQSSACNLAVQDQVRKDAFLTRTAAQAGGQTWGRLARYVVSVMSPIGGNDPCGLSAVDGQALMKRELTIELISRSETEGDRVRISLGKRIC